MFFGLNQNASNTSAAGFRTTDIGCFAPFPGGVRQCDPSLNNHIPAAVDIALLLLPERVDGLRVANFNALPMSVEIDDPEVGGVADPRGWIGMSMTAVGFGRLDIPPPGLGGPPPLLAATRQQRTVQIDGLGGDGDLLLFRPRQTTESGDSGGPTYVGDVDTGMARVVGVHSKTNVDARLTSPPLAAWLRARITGFFAGVYVGPVDVTPDGEPGRTAADDIADPDGDGLVGNHDNCPGVNNPDQRDDDRDGLGDACDLCPDTVDLTFSDPDGDGYNNETCDTCDLPNPDQADRDGDGIQDACDVCADAPDRPGAPNCNLDAELAEGRAILPDACDPVPCPLVRPSDLVVPSGIPAFPHRVETSRIGLTPISNAMTAPGDYDSGFRFCPCADAVDDSVPSRERCRATSGCVIDAAEYRAPVTSWKTMTLASDPRALAPSCRARGARGGLVCTLAYDGMTEGEAASVDWDYRADALRFGYPIDTGVLRRESLQGVLWGHVFASALTCDFGGFGRPLDCHRPPFPLSAARVASHYWSGEARSELLPDSPATPLETFPPILFPPSFCPFCEASRGLGWLAAPTCFPDGACGLDQAVVRYPGFDLPATDFTTATALLSQPDTRFVVPGDYRFGVADGKPLVIALSADGSQLRGALFARDGVLVDGFGQQPPGDIVPAPNAAASTAPTGSTGPAPRSDFGAVYRSLDQTLYVLGGVDAEGGAMNDLWRADASGWTQLGLTLGSERRLGAVLAMALRPRDASLYALVRLEPAPRGVDEFSRRRRRLRPLVALLRLPLNGQPASVEARFPGRVRFRQHALAFDDFGRLLVVAGGPHWAIVLRTDPDDLDDVSGVGFVRGRLASDVVYDGGGLSFMLRRHGGEVVAATLRDEELRTRFYRFRDCL